MERDIRQWAARGKRYGYGPYVTRAVADVAQHLRSPHRIPARIVGEALSAGAPVAWAREFAKILDAYIVREAHALGLEDDPSPTKGAA